MRASVFNAMHEHQASKNLDTTYSREAIACQTDIEDTDVGGHGDTDGDAVEAALVEERERAGPEDAADRTHLLPEPLRLGQRLLLLSPAREVRLKTLNSEL